MTRRVVPCDELGCMARTVSPMVRCLSCASREELKAELRRLRNQVGKLGKKK